jgi:hypothetical protein
MQAQGWLNQVSTAGNLVEVMAVTRSYLSTWPERQLTQLPAGCHPPALASPDDITQYAFALLLAGLHAPSKPSSEIALTCMSTFFSHAATRVSHLKRERGAE